MREEEVGNWQYHQIPALAPPSAKLVSVKKQCAGNENAFSITMVPLHLVLLVNYF